MLADKRALVTGGSHGIGKVIVDRLVKEGARVAFCGRNAADVAAAAAQLEAGTKVLALRADVSDEAQVRTLVGTVVEQFGGLDLLVNNAGIYGPIGPAWENAVSHWKQTIAINLIGAVTVCHAALPTMIAAGGGKIVNISGGGAAGPFPRYTAYGVSKAALVRFTESLALELVEYNVQVNAVSPGFVVTRLHQETLTAGERAGADFARKTADEVERGGADPMLTAELVVWLASSRGDGITGKFLHAVWDKWRDFEHHLDELARTDIYTLRRIMPADRGLDWK